MKENNLKSSKSEICKRIFQGRLILLAFMFLLLCTFSVRNSYSQDKDKIKTGIYKVLEMFSAGDLTGIDKYFDAGYTEHTPAPGQKEGLEGLKEMMAGFRKSFPDLKISVNDIIISDNKAAVLSTLTGTNTGEFMGSPATNKKVTVMGIDWLVFNKEN